MQNKPSFNIKSVAKLLGRRFLAFVPAFLLFLSGCGAGENSEQHFIDRGTLEIPIDQAEMFGVSDHILYSFGFTDKGFTSKKFNAETGETIGETVLSDFTPECLYCCDIEGQTAYIAAEGFTTVGPALYKANLDTGEVVLLYELDPFSTVFKIRKNGDTLYVFGTMPNNSNRNGGYSLYLKNGQYVTCDYNGQRFAELDLANGKVTDSGVMFPIAFDEWNGAVSLYAFDEENGYYFLNYETGEKFYDSYLGSIQDMTLINQNGDFYFPDMIGDDPNALRFYGIGENRGMIQRQTDHIPGTAFVSAALDGYLYTITFGDIVDGVNELLLSGFYVGDIDTAASPIRLVHSELVEPPYGNGYAIRLTQLDSDSFALKVLSLDPGYDVAAFKTDSLYAEGMRKSGSFYSLNDVPGVSEYLDRCFPYVKEAATDSDGNIWALPIRIETPLNIYDEEHCTAEGIVLDTDLNGFFQITDKLGDSGYYSYNQYQLRQSCFSQYLKCNDTFDTPLFREMAQTLKNHWDFDGVTTNWELVLDMCSDAPSESNTKNFLFMEAVQLFDQKRQIGRYDGRMRAAAMPKIETAKPNMVATFLCVNPASENLEETLNYISKLASILGEEKDSFLLADPSAHTDDPYVKSLFEIYQNGEIYFEIPREIYYDDFNCYLEGTLTLDEFIAEADRKLSAYLNE